MKRCFRWVSTTSDSHLEGPWFSYQPKASIQSDTYHDFISTFNGTILYSVSQMSLCNYTANWHSRDISYGNRFATAFSKIQHQCLNWIGQIQACWTRPMVYKHRIFGIFSSMVRRSFFYVVTSTVKRATFSQRLIRDRENNNTWSDSWYVLHNITKSDNRPHILRRH
jgi:hypothetical protein